MNEKQAAVTSEGLSAAPLNSRLPNYSLVLAADRRLSMQRLLPVLSELQAQGILAAAILLRAEEHE